MKILYVLRHAESGWGEPSGADFDRPLNERGVAETGLVARFMEGRGLSPDYVVSSPAVRAKFTALYVAGAGGIDRPIRYDARIYDAHPLDLLKIVAEADESAAELMLVGHNPGLEGLVERLTGARRRLPNAALVRVELKIDAWPSVGDGCGRLDWIVTPRDIEGESV